MKAGEVVKPAAGEEVYRMSNTPLEDESHNALANTAGNVVNFKVEYPKDFKGPKYMKDGTVHKLHVLHAKALEEKGFGKISKTDK